MHGIATVGDSFMGDSNAIVFRERIVRIVGSNFSRIFFVRNLWTKGMLFLMSCFQKKKIEPIGFLQNKQHFFFFQIKLFFFCRQFLKQQIFAEKTTRNMTMRYYASDKRFRFWNVFLLISSVILIGTGVSSVVEQKVNALTLTRSSSRSTPDNSDAEELLVLPHEYEGEANLSEPPFSTNLNCHGLTAAACAVKVMEAWFLLVAEKFPDLLARLEVIFSGFVDMLLGNKEESPNRIQARKFFILLKNQIINQTDPSHAKEFTMFLALFTDFLNNLRHDKQTRLVLFGIVKAFEQLVSETRGVVSVGRLRETYRRQDDEYVADEVDEWAKFAKLLLGPGLKYPSNSILNDLFSSKYFSSQFIFRVFGQN